MDKNFNSKVEQDKIINNAELANCDSHADLEQTLAQEVADPLDTGNNTNDAEAIKLENKTKESTRKSLIDDVVDAIFPRIKNPVGIIIGLPDEKSTKSQEESEKRLLKHRIISMKNRFLLELEAPEKAKAEKERATAQSRLRREKRKAIETPEETAARKERQRILAATSRKRLKELETPEQRAERMAKDREQGRLRLHKKLASETPEERAARRQRQKEYETKKRADCILTMKTGKIRERKKKTPSSSVLEANEKALNNS